MNNFDDEPLNPTLSSIREIQRRKLHNPNNTSKIKYDSTGFEYRNVNPTDKYKDFSSKKIMDVDGVISSAQDYFIRRATKDAFNHFRTGRTRSAWKEGTASEVIMKNYSRMEFKNVQCTLCGNMIHADDKKLEALYRLTIDHPETPLEWWQPVENFISQTGAFYPYDEQERPADAINEPINTDHQGVIGNIISGRASPNTPLSSYFWNRRWATIKEDDRGVLSNGEDRRYLMSDAATMAEITAKNNPEITPSRVNENISMTILRKSCGNFIIRKKY